MKNNKLMQMCILTFLTLICSMLKVNAKPDTLDAYRYYCNAELMLKEAKFDSAIVNASRSATIFFKENNITRYLDCQNIVGDAYCSKGYPDTALYIFKNNLQKSVKLFGNTGIRIGDIYSYIGLAYETLGNFDSSLFYYQKSLNLYKESNRKTNLKEASSYHNIGKIYYYYKDFNKSLELFEKALKIRLDQSKKLDLDIATSYNYIGLVLQNTSRNQDAIEYFKKALDIRLNILGEFHPRVAAVYNNIGLVYQSLGDFTSSLDYHQKSLAIRKSVFGDFHSEIASSYNNIGIVYFSIGDYSLSIDYFKKALENRIKSLSEKHPEVAMYYNNIGYVYSVLGDFEKALVFQNKSLNVYSQIYGDKSPRLAEIFNSIGNSHYYRGELAKALSFYKIATEHRKTLYGEKHYDIAVSYINIGNTYGDMGEYDKALEFYQMAMALRIELLGTHNVEIAQTYNNMGTVHFDKGDFVKSLECHSKALDLRRELLGENDVMVARSYINASSSLVELGNIDLAVEYLKRALNIYLISFGEKHPDVSSIYSNLGAVYMINNRYDSSLCFFKKASLVQEELFPNKHPFKAEVNNALSDLYLLMKRPEDALLCSQKSIVSLCGDFYDTLNLEKTPTLNEYSDWRELIKALNLKAQIFSNIQSYKFYDENELKRIALSHYMLADTLVGKVRNRISSVSDKINLAEFSRKTYEKAINTCIQLYRLTNNARYIEHAFEFSEKNKSQVLLQSIQGVEAQKFAGIPDSLLEKEYELKVNISYYENILAQGLDSAETVNAQVNLFNYKRLLDELIQTFEKGYPKYNDLKYANKNVLISNIQSLIDTKTCIRSYFICDSILYIYNIAKHSFNFFKVDNAVGLNDSVNVFRMSLSGNAKYVNRYYSSGMFLYSLLFPDSLSIDKRIQNLIIVPDRSLAFIPFESLPMYSIVETNSQNYKALDSLRGFKTINNLYAIDDCSYYPFLIKRYGIAYSYSVNLFYQMNLSKQGKHKEMKNISWLAVAPVFDDSSKPILSSTKDLQRNIESSSSGQDHARGILQNGEYIIPLPGTESETSLILNEFTRRKMKSKVLLRNDATESNLKSGILKEYDIVHLATHGFINPYKSELSGILLAQDTLEHSDGILYSDEMYNLDLNADLMVLSACETGLGHLRKGEGIVGLSRALLYAGSKNIMVSLWPVSDRSTSDLMVDFYLYMLNGKKSDSYLNWLRMAKLTMIKSKKYSHPYYWSPFILVGK